MFVLMGSFAFIAGIGDRLYKAAYKMVGDMRGYGLQQYWAVLVSPPSAVLLPLWQLLWEELYYLK